MRKIIDVRCRDCGEVHEEFGNLDDTFRCGSCGGEAKRIISPVRCTLEGVTGDFPGAAIKWERDHGAK
jgi:Zn finger protein HypA/HybF involved in hydrogenase expression